MDQEPPKKATAIGAYWQIFPTCAAMLSHDRYFILCLYPLLVVTSVLMVGAIAPSESTYIVMAGCERMLQLLFCLLVSTRWIRRLSQGPRPLEPRAMLRFFLFGLFLGGLLAAPVVMLMSGDSPALVASALTMAGLGSLLSLRFFFYPIPMLLGRGSIGEALHLARRITDGDPLLPLRLLVAPCALYTLALAIVRSFSPDGRELWTSYGAALVSGIFWLLVTYLSTATALLRLDERVWREENLDPYRTARLSTLEFQGSSWLARQLRPSHGFAWLVVSLVVWLGTMLRFLGMPPAATITVTDIQIRDAEIRLSLHLVDEQYRFRGLQPLYFALAGEQRAVIAPYPSSASLHGYPSSVLMGMPTENADVSVVLTFTASRAGSDLKALKDLYLWYGNNKITLLDMQSAVVEQSREP
ncbi:MAG: hypothetical protein EBZ48_11015 [Proteobacteria bacterium]|nr:hypothetical protein [Pseudomonadota bacterium]